MNHGLFHELVTMSASVTKSVEEAQEQEKCFTLGKRDTVKGREEQAVRQKSGWGEKQTRTEARLTGPKSSAQHRAGEAALAKRELKTKQ